MCLLVWLGLADWLFPFLYHSLAFFSLPFLHPPSYLFQGRCWQAEKAFPKPCHTTISLLVSRLMPKQHKRICWMLRKLLLNFAFILGEFDDGVYASNMDLIDFSSYKNVNWCVVEGQNISFY